MKLGNNTADSEAERAQYFVHVPVAATAITLMFRYAVVFQDPGHPAIAQPRFEVSAYDSLTSDTIPCAHFVYVADSTLPGFHRSLVDTSVFYQAWTTGYVNIVGRGGSTIVMNFASGDCAFGFHFGYGYIDMGIGVITTHVALCSADSAVLTGPQGFYRYTWYDSLSGSIVGNSREVHVPSPPGPAAYGLVIQSSAAHGCLDTLFVHVVPSHLSIAHQPGQVMCPGDVARLHATVLADHLPVSYAWSPSAGLHCPGCQLTDAVPAASTRYVVTVTDALGCQVRDTVDIRVDTVSLAVSGSASLCHLASVPLTAAVSGGIPPFSYSWLPAAGLSCSTCAAPIASPQQSVGYTLTFTDSVNCSLQGTVRIFLDTLSQATRYDTDICNGYPISLHAYVSGNGGPYQYSWSPPLGLSCHDCAEPSAMPDNTTQYIVDITDAYSCHMTDTVNLVIDPCDIFFPSAFTPNGDARNDIIRVVGHLAYYHDFSLAIYNRWGERVFLTTDILAGWDGIYKGAPQDLGTYFYLIQFRLYGIKHVMKGDFQLLR